MHDELTQSLEYIYIYKYNKAVASHTSMESISDNCTKEHEPSRAGAFWRNWPVDLQRLGQIWCKVSKHPKCPGHWHQMAMDQYLLIPFLVGWTSIYQLFWCSPGVLLVLTHCQMKVRIPSRTVWRQWEFWGVAELWTWQNCRLQMLTVEEQLEQQIE